MPHFITVHALTVSPLGLFNRDRANLPKEANYGGYRRARLSSQFQKRHLLDRVVEADIAPRSVRSQYTLAAEILLPIVQAWPQPVAEARRHRLNHVGHVVYETIFRNDPDFGIVDGRGRPDERRLRALRATVATEFYKQDDAILFGLGEIEELKAAVEAAWAEVEADPDLRGANAWPPAEPALVDRLTALARPHGAALRERWEAERLLDGRLPALERAGIVATLCGRMWSTMPDRGVTNALAMSHAITTHELWRDDDFVTVKDDLPLRPDAGGAFLGDTWLVNGCFYRCMAIDLRQLRRNMGGEAVPAERLAELALACLDGFVFARGGAKMGSTAPYMKPALLAVEIGDAHPINAGAAFFDPVRRDATDGVLAESARRLLRCLDDHDRAYLRDRHPTARQLLLADSGLAEALGPQLAGLAGFPEPPVQSLAGLAAWAGERLRGRAA